MNNFIEDIEEIYNFIKKNTDVEENIHFIETYRQRLNMKKEISFSEEYYKQKIMNGKNGVVYTPPEMAAFMVKNLINVNDVIENPFIKVVDPSCGSGNLICKCFLYLNQIFIKNIEVINSKNNLNLKLKDISYHIVHNNLFGFDVDETAIKVLKIDLFLISNQFSEKNFQVKDFLVENIDRKFDVFIGNPPYIGHKSVDSSYSYILRKIYGSIYRDKGDISYCFFQKSLKCLKEGGKLLFVTSRYFCESCSGKELRKFLIENTSIYKIIDFYGIRPFKRVGIDPMIIFLVRTKNWDNNIEIIRPNKSGKDEKNKFLDSLLLDKSEKYKKFSIPQKSINSDGWVFVNEVEKNIMDKIEAKSEFILKDICHSYQGIITGCDRAFIVDRDTINSRKIELRLIKPWVKSSHIRKNEVIKGEKFIIYSNLIENEIECPNAIKYIEQYKKKLMERRECKKGTRKWYELQWGRKPEIFEEKKIVFPYKSCDNRFALDKGSYFSADIYSLVLKKNVPFTYEMLLNILNSSLYEFYFKTFGKKLGENLYEYYPNNLMKLCIPSIGFREENNVEKRLYDFFGLTDKEIQIVEKIKDNC
ncbi:MULTISPECIES: TaqI-like C-terminal specificity domain-containing protein [Clostridium]|uniref:site-specific DNA-methyltransferase (adenine-specific) n=1 Tax=Clostridium ragsdalei P11 TaxID=1353534 RepID=A0A1A6AWR7_9CLOT|nr:MULTISPECIES: TaqI-like C-terminal specificity domain-containing protein [Clostridium]OBR94483.1 modification methylase PaeR7I [Clostridium ragsdalei P11]QXE18488.1 DNA methyltransferase [Clostridium sp. 001]